jgi:hypothetical protein
MHLKVSLLVNFSYVLVLNSVPHLQVGPTSQTDRYNWWAQHLAQINYDLGTQLTAHYFPQVGDQSAFQCCLCGRVGTHFWQWLATSSE